MSAYPHLARERSKSPRNCLRDVWYMTFTILISVIRKYRMLPLVATGITQGNTKAQIPTKQAISFMRTFLNRFLKECSVNCSLYFYIKTNMSHILCEYKAQGLIVTASSELKAEHLCNWRLTDTLQAYLEKHTKKEGTLFLNHFHLPGRYSSLAALIWISVSAAICNFWVTSSAVHFVLLRTRIRLSSSTKEP